MQKKIIPVFIEPTYRASVWFSKSISGIRDSAARQRLNIQHLNSISELYLLKDKVNSAILVSSKTDWTQYMNYEIKKLKMKTVLLGESPSKFGEDVSGPVLNRQAVVENMVYYFYSCGRKKLAAVGNDPNSSNDNIRCNAFLGACKYLNMRATLDDVYFSDSDYTSCIELFFNKIDAYDGAICANDYVAVLLLKTAQRKNIPVPDKLYIAGSGNLMIGSCCSPTLTTSTLDYYEMGMQAINICTILEKSPTIASVSFTIPSEMICRGSTAFSPCPSHIEFDNQFPSGMLDTNIGPAALTIKRLENCLHQCDELDFRIICGILQGESYEALSNKMFISEGTIHYRLRNLYSTAGVSSRADFNKILNLYVNNKEMANHFLPGKNMNE